MAAPLDDLGRRFRFNDNTLGMATAGLDAEEWAAPPSAKGGNNAHWILGHIASTRRYLLRKLGEEIVEEAWEQEFGASATPRGTEGYPPPGAMLEDFSSSGRKLGARLAEMSAEELEREWGAEFPDGGRTLGDGARFLYMHECYHIGQLGLLRRIHGKPGFV